MIELFEYNFFLNAVIASILASIACGIIGSYIVVKRIVFISGGIAHTAYGGIGLGYLIGINPLIGALGFSVGAAGAISFLRLKHNQNEDTLIGILWAFGMSLGILFVSFSPGYSTDLMSYLFGNILTVPVNELILIAAIDLIIIMVVWIFFEELRAITFDEEYSRAMGLKVERFYLMLLILIAFTVVVLIKLVGIILAIALLTIPAALAKLFVKSLGRMIAVSITVSLLVTIVGLFTSYYLNLPAGSTIIIVAIAGYAFAYIFNSFQKRRKEH